MVIFANYTFFKIFISNQSNIVPMVGRLRLGDVVAESLNFMRSVVVTELSCLCEAG